MWIKKYILKFIDVAAPSIMVTWASTSIVCAQSDSALYPLNDFDIATVLTPEQSRVAIFILIALLIGVLFLNLWSVIYRRPSFDFFSSILARSVDNLFLKIQLETADKKLINGYLRKLSVKEAHVVISEKYKVGAQLVIKSESLPDYPKGGSSLIEGKIYKIDSFGSQPESYLVRIRFKELKDNIRQPLEVYLSRLGYSKSLVTQT